MELGLYWFPILHVAVGLDLNFFVIMRNLRIILEYRPSFRFQLRESTRMLSLVLEQSTQIVPALYIHMHREMVTRLGDG